MDVSIILATLNEEKFLRPTLESLVNQNTSKKFEIIIGDGESSDKTVDIAKEYGCRVVTVEPGIIALGRQAAAKYAKGKIIVSCDADTIYPPNWLDEITDPLLSCDKNTSSLKWLKAITKTLKKDPRSSPKWLKEITKSLQNHPTRTPKWLKIIMKSLRKDVVATCGKLAPADGNTIEKFFADAVLHPVASFSYLVKTPFAAAGNMAVRKDVFDRIGGFNTSLITGEDTDLMKRLMLVGRVVYRPNAVCFMSMRRVKKWGYRKYLAFHTSNFIKSHMGKTPFQSYKPVR
ncbi:Dolichyl N-acetyl-alpha-D-glucosaminyl phosphate 3-beta-D-2,3-diacetamido-2,3-dideoxy-beta-D-glucuronosyltransferase [Candidatus Bilamarchaeum dharawalense]|uniref:Dolichyl N-acetyl-alpha-D-glucosaminyl phosphate 3-beta-D-2,3-diacetamido-2,3-dideoxy-beta-D-glucuronosyltransferase n=1 Tax=Candidatus Bilamarchaeum dharawalense TaxID=2885759 RepID=A0A5E4LW75_9ARCH|nr:Dolichyl N-acetyl-alpha-D-glucosaminyl phosphate 3-beta-D-2,3-diacetamido-2,3-dideoxy-beta-D-glucuronosyltransferase [Candidatus Bilamarchaeum dharawalense]